MSLNGFAHQWHDDGEGNKIHESAVINWERVSIGSGNEIGPGVCIGTDAQHRNEDSIGEIIIGDNNVIREYTTIHLPTRWSEKTIIGNNCLFMVLSHVAHDCVIEDDVIMTNNVVLGGHVYIMRGCQLGFGTIIHQYQTLGSYCMFGMGTIITSKQTVVPGGLWYGNPGKFSKNNIIGLNRHKVDDKLLNSEYQRYRAIKNERSKYRYE